MTHSQAVPLSVNEQITLRGVAYGESDGVRLRAPDLQRLRELALIDGSTRVPTLTAEGKQRFDTLPKPVASTASDAVTELTEMFERVRAHKTRGRTRR